MSISYIALYYIVTQILTKVFFIVHMQPAPPHLDQKIKKKKKKKKKKKRMNGKSIISFVTYE